jgi:carbamate kinase
VRIVAALGGNALLRRGESADAAPQVGHVTAAVRPLAALAAHHELVVTHGNGPQVGLLALETATDPALSAPYPLDALGAETQGMIGYWLARELGNALPGREVVALVTQTLVDANDPAFRAPTKFVGPGYPDAQARRLAAQRRWRMARDGHAWRRVVASPCPRWIVELPAIRRLADAGVLVVAAGGGGVPVTRRGHVLSGVEAVVDKDLTAALLAEAVGAELLLLLTDVPAVFAGFGTPAAYPLVRVTPEEIRRHAFPAGSMGPKVEAACRFVERTGGRAAIGALEDADRVAAGRAGTQVLPPAARSGPTPAHPGLRREREA